MYLQSDLHPSRILHSILNDPLGKSKEYTYIILGDGPRTGKSWLCTGLKIHGFNAFKISEDITGLVTYRDQTNHCIVDDFYKRVTIVLNKRYENLV